MAVLDTNVLASGFVGQGQTAPVQILERWRTGSFGLILSRHLLTELARTLQRPYFKRRLTAQEIDDDILLLEKRATIISITARVSSVATHPEDDLILATALSAGAHYLVTGDKNLLDIGTFHETRIMSPVQFLEVLASSG